MTTSFPGSLDTFTNPASTDPLTTGIGHAAQHDNLNDAVLAIETALGANLTKVKFIQNSISASQAVANLNDYLCSLSVAITLTASASPTAGDEFHVWDVLGNAATYNITVSPNGGKINGVAQNFVINTNSFRAGFKYLGATQGWQVF